MKHFKFIFLIVISFFVSLPSIAQTEEIAVFTDTTMVLGVVNDLSFLGDDISAYCTNNYKRTVDKESIVIICAIKKCTGSTAQDITYYYEVSYKGKQYFIRKELLTLFKYSFDDIKNLNAESSKRFREHAVIVSQIIYEDEVAEAVNFLSSCKPLGLAIYDWSYYDQSEYTEGTGLKITVYNPTAKTVKYLWFSFIGYNPVGDKVIDRKSGSSVITRKAVGPILKGETAAYDFEYAWLTDLVETAKISSIKVMYMDGSQKIIANPKAVMLKSKYLKLFEEN